MWNPEFIAKQKYRNCTQYGSGFSLVELLVVLGLMSLLMALAVPALRSVVGGNDMTMAADLVASQLRLARHTSIARNRNTEVRFYCFKDAFQEERYRSLQLFTSMEDASSPSKPLGRIQNLPTAVCIDSGMALSPLISSASVQAGSGGIKIPGTGFDYHYVAISFRPDGSVQAASGTSSFLTLRSSRLAEPQLQLPPNYAVIQVFQDRGLIRIYRP